MLMRGLAALPQSYFQGTQNRRQLALQQPASTDPDVLLQQAAERGGVEYMKDLPYMLLSRAGGNTAQSLSDLDAQVSGAAQPRRPNLPNAASPANFMPNPQAPANVAAPGSYATEGQQSIRTLTQETAGADVDVMPIISNVARSLRIHPDRPLTPPETTAARSAINAQLSNRVPGIVSSGNAAPSQTINPVPTAGGTQEGEYSSRGNASAIDASSQAQAQRSPGVSGAPGPMPSTGPETTAVPSGIAPQGLPSPVAAIQQAQNDPQVQRLLKAASIAREIAAREAIRNPAASQAAIGQANAYEQRARLMLEAAGKAAELTPAQREAATAGMSVPEYAGRQELYKKAGEAAGKRIGEVIEAGGLAARHTVNTLNVMESALNKGGTNISTGPGAEGWLKVKQAANNLWPGLFKGVPESEVIMKLNAQLASQAAKAMTARPSQLEFRAFMQNNPGLMTSVEGTKILISVLRQAGEQDIKLSRLAMNQNNLANWTQVEDAFYSDPRNMIVGPWQTTATNPRTGQRLILSPDGTRWLPAPR
jgi:hypothetical protein